jgi:two-component system, cell cycle response regulator
MPKNRKMPRKPAETVRVASFLPDQMAAGGEQTGSLLVVQGAEIDLGRHVMCDRPITIGRDERADLTLSDGSISRAHCMVDRHDGGYILVDLGSTNGTTLNGERVEDRMPLQPGDKIFIGASVIRFAYSDQLDLQFHSRLEEMVSIDPLTGMSSKRQYDATYRAMLERATAEDSPLTVMVMDMDGLKIINDTYGHEMGGFVIAEVAGLIRTVLEEHGYLCRFGGDEFVGCFAGLEKARAVQLAEEVRDKVAHHVFVHNGERVEPTISIGVACYPADVEDPNQLFGAADRAMYEAKRHGKNQVKAIPPAGPG